MAPNELTVFGQFYVFCFGCVFLYTLYCILRGWYLMFQSFSLLIRIQNKQRTLPRDAVAYGSLPAKQTPEFIAHQAMIRQSNKKFLVVFFWMCGVLAGGMMLDFAGILKLIKQ